MCFVLEILQLASKNKTDRMIILRCTGLIGACLAIMYFRLWIMAFEGPIFTKIDNAAAYSDNLYTKVKIKQYI